jgi:hypothetical protein
MTQMDAPASNSPPKTCVFCGHPVRDPATNRTRAREHVFSFWALDEFGITRDRIEFSPFEAAREDGASLQLTAQTPIRRFDLNSFLLGAVCSTCNSGWMSRLESRVQPALTALIRDRTAKASNVDGLAKWALKTSYVLWRYLEPPVGRVPTSHGKQLVGDGTALPKHVAVFHRQATDWRVWFSLCMTFAVEGPNPSVIQRSYRRAYKVLLQFGHAQFLVQYFPYSGSEIAYDPLVSTLLNANAAVVQDSGLKIADVGIADPNFKFMMSNLIRKV